MQHLLTVPVKCRTVFSKHQRGDFITTEMMMLIMIMMGLVKVSATSRDEVVAGG